MSGTPYTRTFELTSTNSADAFYTLQFPGRGTLTSFRLAQVPLNADDHPSLDGFLADLFTSVVPSDLGVVASLAEFEQYRLIPTQAAAPSEAIVQLNGEYPYVNQDGNPSQYPRLLYLFLSPGGSSTKKFILTLTQLAPSFR